MPLQSTLAQGHPAETWAALLGSLAIVVALLGVLYKRINDDLSNHSGRLETGAESFVKIGEDLVKIGGSISSLERVYALQKQDVVAIQASIRDLEKRLLTIEVEHKRCQEVIRKLNHE